MRGPGIKAKSLVKETTVNIDIAPTIIEMAGLPANSHMDGWSFLQYATKTAHRPPHKCFLLEYVGEGDAGRVSSQCPLVNDNTLTVSYI